ncbi:hypothetical protein FJ546_06005 [Mesorhizobium sp. B2-4-19]|uniref:hypothetical protein n=1 Tax=Mesorhizobium sp. B2-4-19 TaxID=2589930 RepID=UPI00112DC24B|nr:hypothetical protein [Mesorhizobium sp. B2-4-19]TPK66326.1 hypothetical protein FJ546_06005 [Mesorhizobium sp. B2-4-19]
MGAVVDPFRRTSVWFESDLEQSALVVLLTLPETLEVREQQKAEYIQHGEKRKHYFDFVQRQASGRIAYAVKYEQDVDDELLETLRLISEQQGDRFADQYRILTEKDLTLTQIENAREILAYASDFDFEGQALVSAALQRLPARVLIADIVRTTGLGERGRRAAVALIQKGLLKVPANVRLADNAFLINRAAHEGRR